MQIRPLNLDFVLLFITQFESSLLYNKQFTPHATLKLLLIGHLHYNNGQQGQH